MFTSASAIANPTTFKAEDYEELELIGRGSFGLIRKVRRRSDGRIFARKEIDWRLMSDAEKHQLVAEVNILDQIRHPNIVRYYSREVKRDACLIYLYMEYCGGGDLGRWLEEYRRRGERVGEEDVWELFGQLVSALHECHNPPSITAATRGREARKTILHRDLKPENIFLSTPTSSSTPVASLGSAAIAPTPKLGDFGLSKSLDDAHALARTYVGTPYYMSPELINSQPYSAKSDIWALGCVLYEICALKPPFNGKNHRELGIAIESGRFDVDSLSGYGTAITEVIAACLQLNPLARPTTQDLLTHPMVRSGLSSRAMKTR
ncbi:kinase-like protein, partial [Saitoella complicata NRRL Y-17804]